jgi:VanZ family protein
MPLLSRRSRWVLVAVVALVILLAAVVRPGSGVGRPGPFGLLRRDLWLHALAYLALELAVVGALTTRGRVRRTLLLGSCCAVFAYGFGIELLQLAVPYRSFSTADLAANGAGILAAAVVWLLGPNTE